MPLLFKRGDVLSVECDALVVPINNSMSARTIDCGVFEKVCSLANSGLTKELVKSGGCETGKAKIFDSFGLDCKHLIFTAGPRWKGGDYNETEFLRSCYKESFALALSSGCGSVAFPIISSGNYGMDKDIAIRIAISTLKKLVAENDITVYLTFYDDEAYLMGEKIIPKALGRRIEGVFYDIVEYFGAPVRASIEPKKEAKREKQEIVDSCMRSASFVPSPRDKSKDSKAGFIAYSYDFPLSIEDDIDKQLEERDESFSDMIVRKLNEKDMKNSECYKRANVTKQLFSKIISNAQYKTTKPTALAFAVALKLDFNETEELLRKAGYAFSKNYPFDVIVEYFIRRKQYDIFLINEVLFKYDQPLLGSK